MFSLQFFHIPKILSPTYGKKVCRALEKIVPIPQEGTVNLIAVSPEEMAWMNEQYRGKEGPTDILTFSFREEENRKQKTENRVEFLFSETKNQNGGSGTPPRFSEVFSVGERRGLGGVEKLVAGEIYLCLEKIQIYAKESGRSYKEQLEYIIIHGLVHLLGFDHETVKDSKKMEEMEGRIQKML